MGTPSLSVPFLDSILKSGRNVAYVVTQTDKLKGSSVTLGVEIITNMSHDLETAARENRFDEQTEKLAYELVHNFEIVTKELEIIKEKYSKL